MDTENINVQQQFIVFYHTSVSYPSKDTSIDMEELIENHKKEPGETVILRLTNSNLIIQTTTNNEIINVSYKNISNYIWSKRLSPFFGISIINDDDNSCEKCCYIFSINTHIHDHTFHQKFNQIFHFNCLPNTELLIKECQQFPTTVENILEATLLCKNKSLFKNNDDNTSSLPLTIGDGVINDPSQCLDESIIKCHKRKISSPLFFDRMSNKRASLVEGLLVGNKDSQYINKSSTLCNKDKNKTSTNLSRTTSSTFWETLQDPTFKECFMKFLTEQYCQENLSFYLIVGQYKCMESNSKRCSLGSQIIKRFIEDDADEQVNIDNKTRQTIIDTVKENECPKNLFDQAYLQIEDMLKFDLMPRFLKTSSQQKPQDTNDKENTTRRKLSFNNIKNKLLKIKAKNSLLPQNVIPPKVPPPPSVNNHHNKKSLIVGTFRRSFVKPRPNIGYLFRNSTLSRSL
uniref:Regulator of G-protein signaling rgs-6 (inferred by orthology to a C. elegans protein) n=1 Tax=Strongyloides venezuelensis TaxID=75913 RepID=A0A0K0FGS1_STRVS